MTFQWKLGTIGLNLRAASLTLLRVINPKNQNKIERIGQKESSKMMATVWVGYWIKFEISVAETYSDIEICKVVRFAKQLTAFTRYFCNILKIRIFDVWLGSEHTPR